MESDVREVGCRGKGPGLLPSVMVPARVPSRLSSCLSTLPEKSAISQKAGKVSCRMEFAHDSFEEWLLFTRQLKQQTFTLESVEARVQGRGVAEAARRVSLGALSWPVRGHLHVHVGFSLGTDLQISPSCEGAAAQDQATRVPSLWLDHLFKTPSPNKVTLLGIGS